MKTAALYVIINSGDCMIHYTKISVRSLVEFVLKNGDIDSRRMTSANKDAMLAGGRIHRKIQKSKGALYQAEVPLSFCMQKSIGDDELNITVDGRADGIFEEDGLTWIDEIKGVYRNLDAIEEPELLHMAQASCYAYFYGVMYDLEEVGVQITYCNIETEIIKDFREVKKVEDLEYWFNNIVDEFLKFKKFQVEHEKLRNASAKALEFPYEYRKGQKELAIACYRTLVRERKIFLEAPTGIGKTLATVFPAVKAIGEEKGQKIFYLTAKTITRTVAEKTIELLRDKGLKLSAITLTAKEKLCVLDKPSCNPDECPRAKGHFDRVNDALYDMICNESCITKETVEDYAARYQLCPYEFSLDISLFTDAIICDYNYAFDPDVRLRRYFGEGEAGEYFLLIDEAHNLVNRAREMFSCEVVKEDFLEVRKLLKERPDLEKLVKRINKVNSVLLEYKRSEGLVGNVELLEDFNNLILPMDNLKSEFERLFEKNIPLPDDERVLDLYFEARKFVDTSMLFDDCYRAYSELRKDGSFAIKLYCINPINNLAEILNKCKSTVFFSATLLPIQYYRELLSNDPEDYTMYTETPFSKEKRRIFIASDVSSKYTRRTTSEYVKISEYIYKTAEAKKGNYMVFLPSYQYLEDLTEVFITRPEFRNIEFQIQERNLNEQEKEEFLQLFNEERDKSFVVFCVTGGLFSEGIDLTGEKLIGAVIVGTGLPMVCSEQEILRGYFADNDMDGFSYAYQYPGMTKVLQAAGRVIRTDTDRGVIMLLDERFLRRDYKQLFPREWDDTEMVRLGDVADKLKKFWDSQSLR